MRSGEAGHVPISRHPARWTDVIARIGASSTMQRLRRRLNVSVRQIRSYHLAFQGGQSYVRGSPVPGATKVPRRRPATPSCVRLGRVKT